MSVSEEALPSAVLSQGTNISTLPHKEKKSKSNNQGLQRSSVNKTASVDNDKTTKNKQKNLQAILARPQSTSDSA